MGFSGVAFFFLLCLSILATQATSSRVYDMENEQTLFSPRATSSKVYNKENDQTLFWPRATSSKLHNIENDQTLFSPRATSSKVYNKENDQTLFWPRATNSKVYNKENDQTLFWPRATSSKVHNNENDQTLFWPRATSSKVYNKENDQTLIWPRSTSSKVYNKKNDQTLFSSRATSSKVYKKENDQTLFSPRNDQTLISPPAIEVDPNNPNFDLFIRMDDLKLGGKMAVYFPVPDDAPLLSKEEAEKLPLHTTKISETLEYFGFQEGSKEAKAVEKTMAQCQPSSTKGGVKFCAATLDSLLESAKPFFRQLDDVMVTTTKIVPNDFSNLLQNYTVVEEPKVVNANKMMGCHVLPYPNLLYFCHGHDSENKLLKASLVGENGWRVEAVGICHMDTSGWSPKHPVFEKMHTSPGKAPLCHFFPSQNLVFFPSTINL